LPDNRQIILLLGGARSGKSYHAQALAEKFGGKVLFIATGEALDEEMKDRIDKHKKNRPKGWKTIESPWNISNVITEHEGYFDTVIIDCVTLLVSNLLGNETNYSNVEQSITDEIVTIINVMKTSKANIIMVTNEVGLGLVPDNKLGRIYRDLLGKANNLLAQNADEVYLMIAGIPVKIKDVKIQ